MSIRKLQRIKHATDRYRHTRDVVLAELERGGAPRALLDAAVELCGLYVECTGGTLETVALRAELATLRARVAETPVVRVVDEAPATYWPTDADWLRQVERERTAHWTLTETPEGILYAPHHIADRCEVSK